MKIVIINGSARKGNTLTAINTFIKGAAEHNEIEMISPDKLHIAPCKGCMLYPCGSMYLTIQSNNNYHVKTIISDIFTVLFDFYFDLGRGFRQESERTCM